MERKWYLDLWALIREPFKRGIPEIVEFGTIQRGFACSIGMLVINLLVSWSLGFGLSYFLGNSPLQLGVILGVMAGAGIFTVVFYALMAFAVLAIYSVIFSQIANKFGAHTNYESILKICWYQGAYSMVISLILSIVQTILVLIVNGLNLDVYWILLLDTPSGGLYLGVLGELDPCGASNRKKTSFNFWYRHFSKSCSSSFCRYISRPSYACCSYVIK